MAVLGTCPDCTLSSHALAVWPVEGFFFNCGRPTILLHAEVMGLLLFTIKIMSIEVSIVYNF